MMKFFQAMTLSILVYSIQAANVPIEAEQEVTTYKYMEFKMNEASHKRAGKNKAKEAIKVQEFKHDASDDLHAITARSASIITVSECSKTITGITRPMYIQIVGNEAYVVENIARGKVYVFDTRTGLVLRKFIIPDDSPHGLFIKGNRVLVTNYRRETYSFSLTGDLISVHYSHQPVTVIVDYNGLMYTTEWTTGNINVFNIDGTKSHTLSIGTAGYLRKIQFDTQGNLYVGESGKKTIFVFDRRGTIMQNISVPTVANIEGIHINPLDESVIYVADRTRGAGKVVKVKIATGEVIKTFTGLSEAFDIAIAPDEKIWITDLQGNSIRIFHH